MEDVLQGLECPYTWNIPSAPSETMKILKSTEERNDFLLDGYIFSIIEIFELERKDEIEVAIRKAQHFEEQLKEYYPVGLFSKNDQYLWERSRDALWHVLISTQAHIAFRYSDHESAEEKILKIIPVESFDDNNKAALWAIKCSFIQFYIHEEYSLAFTALECARKAVQLDDSVPCWHFLLGKSLARHRRKEFPFDPPSDEEVNTLKRAYEECKKPNIGVMLLQTYSSLLKFSRGLQYERLKETILTTIHDIKAFAGSEWYIYWRCAHVCVRLKFGIVPPEEIKELIDLAVEFSEKSHNTNTKHLWEVKAAYYKFIEKDFKKALEYSIKAADEGERTCVYDVIKLSYFLRKDQDLLPLIDKYLDQFGYDHQKNNSLYIVKANYLMFVKEDFTQALKMYLNVMKRDCKSYIILKCRPLFEESNHTYNLYQKLTHKLKNIIHGSSPLDDIDSFKEFLQTVRHYEKLSEE